VNLGRLELVVVGLILVTAVTIKLETLPDLPQGLQSFLRGFEWVTVILFTVEYIARLLLARPRKAYALGFFGIIDLLAVLPFYFSAGIDLRSLRLFRFLRIFRLLKLGKYMRGGDLLYRSFRMVKEELFLFFLATGITIYLLAMGIYYFEHPAQPEVFSSVFDGMWWAVCTVTTVGYGDAYPITVGGRLFTMVILLSAIGMIAVPTGLIAAAITRTREDDSRYSLQERD